MDKIKKKSFREGHRSKILIGAMIFIGLFLMNFASAELFTFDNVKTYYPETQTIEIRNSILGIPFLQLDKIAEIKLNTPMEVVVPVGYQKVAEFQLANYEDYLNAFKKMEFYNIKDNMKSIERQFDYKVLTNLSYKVNDYGKELICGDNEDLKNLTKSCYYEIIGEHTEYYQDWLPLEKVDFVKGEILTIGIFTEVRMYDNVEWVLTAYGKDITEWASYVQSSGTKTYVDIGGLNYTIETFTSNGYFNTTKSMLNTSVLVVAGGGGGGAVSAGYHASGGGGAGGINSTVSFNISAGNYVIQVGAGGNKGYTNNTPSISGFNSSIGTIVTAHGGGAGGGYFTSDTPAKAGGSGGGGINAVGGGATPAGQGNAGGTGATNGGGGGGGKGAVGSNGDGTNGGAGGAGQGYNFYNGTLLYYGGGGGGASRAGTAGAGGIGGGGAGGTDNGVGSDATVNTGGGGGAGGGSATAFANGGAGGSGIVIIRYLTSDAKILVPSVTLNSPIDYYNTTNATITFNITVTDNQQITNVTLYIDGIVNVTDTSQVNGSYQWIKTLSEGNHNWSILAYNNNSQSNQSTNRYFSIDLTPPVLTTTGIIDKYNYFLPINLTWSLFNADPHSSNCWYYTTENATNISVTCNTSTITNFTSGGSKTIYYFGNDSLGYQSTGSQILYVGYYPYNHNSSKQNVGVGDSVVFTLYVNGTNINTLWPETNATLNFNGTTYSPDTTDKSHANYIIFTKTLYMAIGNSTGAITPYNWTSNVKNTTNVVLTTLTATNTIKVYLMSVYDCSGVGGRYILNLSIKNEELNSLINASLNTTNIEVDLVISSRANTSATWNFSKQWVNNNSVAVCVPLSVLTYSSYKIDFTIGYKANGYVQEFYYMDNGTIDNTNYFNSYTTNPISLMDLKSADSTTFLFKFKDQNNLEVDDAIIHVFRKYIGEGVFREIERAEQDNNGETHIHLVGEDVIYYFMVTQYGHIIYISSQYNAKCLSTPCQIELTASASFIEFPTDYDQINGTSYLITRDATARTVTLTFVSNASKTINLSLFKYYNGVVSYIDTSSQTGTSGEITLNIPYASGNQTFFASVFEDGKFIRSEWVDFKERAQDYFGTTGAILGGLLILALIFMAISEGVILIVIGCLAVLLIGAMQLVDLSWLAIISIICAGALIIWKLTSGGKR